MGILDIVLLIFIALETANVLIIYLNPDFKYGNGLSVFRQWEELRKEESSGLFVKYMANWVAGCKVIFIALVLIIVFTADEFTKICTVAALVPTISLYYIKLHPIIKRIDDMGQLRPQGYSKTLVFTISGFVLMFVGAIVWFLMS